MSLIDNLKSVLVPIHKEGYPFIAIAAFISLLITFFSSSLGALCWLITLWVVYFFRDPERIVPQREGLLVSPADGVICAIGDVTPPEELKLGETPLTRVSIFMNVFDVHVNRAPIAGSITAMHYWAGAYFNASLDKASEQNERQGLKITLEDGKTEIGVVQIAGFVARRILAFKEEGDKVATGERFGMIRFGSRVDVYLPPSVTPLVIEGQRMIGGETIIADLQSKETARTGTVI